MFERFAKAIPIRQRDAIQCPGACFAEVQKNHAEAAGVYEKISGTQGVLQISRAADPN
jgi:hypothetical protein